MNYVDDATSGGDPPLVPFTWFERKDAPSGVRKQMAWGDLCQLIASAPCAATKDALPLIKLATFMGDHRTNATAEGIYGVEGDYDAELMQPGIAAGLLINAGITAFISTTPSHRLDRPRWRVFCPLSRPATPSERHGHVARLNGALNGALAPESFTISQAYYVGSVEGGEPVKCWNVAGRYLDTIEGLIPCGPPDHGGGQRIAPETAVRAPTYQIAYDALQSRDPGDMDRNEWLLFSGGFYTATIGSVDDDQALADWQAWNVEYGSANDPIDNATTWEDFRRNGTNGDFRALADLGMDANAKGWRWFGGVDRSGELPAVATTRPTIDAASFFIRASDMEYRPPEYHIDGLIETDAVAVVFGDPATCKSFIAMDMACCVATGHDFHGHLTKQGAVFYIAGEGHNGIKRRLTAWETHNNVQKDAPLYISQASAKFLNRESAAMVENAISTLTVEHGAPKLIFVDTLARNFGDGDENSQKDMTMFMNAMDVLRCRFPGCTVVIVHHSGHGDKDRARGSSVLKGAVDAEFKTSKTNDVIKLENLKMKDGSPPRPMEFRIDKVGHSAALTYLGEPKPSSGGLTTDQRLALEAFNECGTDIVATPQWRLRFYEKRGGTPDANKQAFQRSRKYLVETGLLITDDDGANYRRAPMPGMMPLSGGTA